MSDAPIETQKANPFRGDDADAVRAFAFGLLSSMSLERRAVLALAIAQRLSYREIAQRLAIAEDEVKRHLRDGMTVIYRAVMSRAHPRLP